MASQLKDLTLRHVDPSKLLFQQRHPALDVEEPDWYTNATPGGMWFTAWLRGTVLASMEMRVQKPAYYAVVTVLGLFGSDEQEAAQAEEFSSEIDDSILSDATEDERAAFARRAVSELYPFVRSEVYALTGKMQGVTGVMLQPAPLMTGADMQVLSIRDAIRHAASALGFNVSTNISTWTDTYEGELGTVSAVFTDGYDDLVSVSSSDGQDYPDTPTGAMSALHALGTTKVE